MFDEEKLSTYLNKAKLLSNIDFEKKIRIAILGSFTLNGLEETIRVKCADKKIQSAIYVSGYNQYNQIINLVKIFVNKTQSKLVLSNFVIPTYSPFEINEAREEFGLQDMVRTLNQNIKTELSHNPEIYLYDLNSFVTKFGENNVFDYKQFFYGDVKISLDYIPHLAEEFMGYIKAVLGLNKKCIVLDLDNTLWGGIVGEDGFEGIKLGDGPIGRAYVEFQRHLLALNQRGIILAINSKNNFDDAIEIIRKHPNMVLKEDNFACFRINWNDKVINIKEIAEELNIGLDSIVFFDDDPINRDYMRTALPDVLTVELSDSSSYSRTLKSMNDFQVLQITNEDVKRNKMYLDQRKRNELQKNVGNLQDFLKQLNISVKIKKADEYTIPRISQLTLKTNQFNLTTRRYQEEDIRKFVSNENKIVECAQIQDKFGDNGITSVYILNKENQQEWLIDTFLLSCRVMGRGVEEAILGQIIERAKMNGIKTVKAQYIKTKKNKPAENFLSEFGFVQDGNIWIFETKKPFKKLEHLVIS